MELVVLDLEIKIWNEIFQIEIFDKRESFPFSIFIKTGKSSNVSN